MNKTAVIIDFSHLFFRYVFANEAKINQNPNFLPHLLLNSIIETIENFKINKSNVLVLALDTSRAKTWRRKIYPLYKANRDEKSDNIDWETFYDILADLIELLKTSTDIHVLKHEEAEADDIIYVGTKFFKETIIISSDKDFLQLQSDIVKQYDPIKKKYMSVEEKGFTSTEDFLKYHICMGDKIDNIPNVRRGWGDKTIRKHLSNLGELFKTDKNIKEIKENYLSNEILIDLNKLPEIIDKDIKSEYNSIIKTSNYHYMNLLKYCKKHNLKKIMDNVQKFKFEETNNLNDFF